MVPRFWYLASFAKPPRATTYRFYVKTASCTKATGRKWSNVLVLRVP